MNHIDLPTAPRGERLSWDQICARYPDEWVVLAELEGERAEDPGFATAVVVAHARRRAGVAPATRRFRSREGASGCFWTGEEPPSASMALAFLEGARAF